MSVEDVFDVSGVAVITGGAGGFGLEIGQRCAAAGMRVALLDVVDDKLRVAADSCAGDATIPVVCDVTDPKSCAAALEAVELARRRHRLLVRRPAPCPTPQPRP